MLLSFILSKNSFFEQFNNLAIQNVKLCKVKRMLLRVTIILLYILWISALSQGLKYVTPITAESISKINSVIRHIDSDKPYKFELVADENTRKDSIRTCQCDTCQKGTCKIDITNNNTRCFVKFSLDEDNKQYTYRSCTNQAVLACNT